MLLEGRAMSRSAPALLTAACCALAACAPTTDEATSVVVLAYQPELERYDRHVVQLHTIDDIVTLKGSVAEVIGGAELDFDAATIDGLVGNAGSGVKADFIDVDGVLVPTDFHSLNMVTAYYNLERSALFFEGLGLNLIDYGQKTLYYFPTVTMFGEEAKDNAFFSAALNGFAVLPFDEFQTLPLAINLGIMGHEFTHSVFNYYVCDADPFCPLSDPTFTSNEAANLITSLDEGIADFMGAAIVCGESFDTCDPNFMAPSMPSAYASTRNLSRRRCISDGMEEMLHGDVNVFYNEGYAYILGTVLASSLWRAVEELGGTPDAWQQIIGGVINALGADTSSGLRGLGQQELASGKQGIAIKEYADHLTLESALDVIAEQMNGNAKKVVCETFLDRFALTTRDLPVCANYESAGECSSRSIGGAL